MWVVVCWFFVIIFFYLNREHKNSKKPEDVPTFAELTNDLNFEKKRRESIGKLKYSDEYITTQQ